MEGWLKVYVNATSAGSFLTDEIHSRLGCIGCHGGEEGLNTKDLAHVGMNPDPSEGENNKCADLCHNAELAHFEIDSVHATQIGYKELFSARSGLTIEGHPEFEEGFAADCGSCHASCGDCHISQPKNVGGGLIAGHQINKRPDRVRNCMACHGSRVGDEYTGANAYAGSDVHWLPNLMHCVDCHPANEMHGTPGANPKTRYEEPAMPRCENCHTEAVTETMQENQWHAVHLDPAGSTLQCQACHSQSYKSCNGCHVGEGITGASYETLKIGRNPIPDVRDYQYVLVRHIPIVETTFEGWGLEELANFSAVETWKYTSPHNIRRWTDQTDTTSGKSGCSGCHSDDPAQDFFLRQSDVDASELEANNDVIVPLGTPFSLDR